LLKNTGRPFSGGHTKKGLLDLYGKKVEGKIRTKNVSGKFGLNSGKNSFTHKVCLLLHFVLEVPFI